MDFNSIQDKIPANPDAQAKEEEANYKTVNKHRREKDRVRHLLEIGGMILLVLVVASVMVIRICHMVIPLQDQWLSVTQLTDIDKFTQGAIGGGVLTVALKGLMGKQ